MIRKNKVRVDIFGEYFRTRASQLTPGLRVIASHINGHREVVLGQMTMEVAAALDTSDATAIRAIQALGFAGLHGLKRTLKQWLGPALSSGEKMSTMVGNLTSDVNITIDFVLEGHLCTCDALSEPENCHTLTQAVALLVRARQVAIFGIGTSGTLADYTTRLFNRIGLSATALNRTGIGLAGQLVALQRGDVLIMMAQKSAHRERLATLHETGRLGVPVILLTNALDSRFSKDASIAIHAPREGEKGEMPLHGTVLLCLEIIVWSIASAMLQRAVKTIKRINDFHRGLKTGRKNG